MLDEAKEREAANRYADDQFGDALSTADRNVFIGGWIACARARARMDEGRGPVTAADGPSGAEPSAWAVEKAYAIMRTIDETRMSDWDGHEVRYVALALDAARREGMEAITKAAGLDLDLVLLAAANVLGDASRGTRLPDATALAVLARNLMGVRAAIRKAREG